MCGVCPQNFILRYRAQDVRTCSCLRYHNRLLTGNRQMSIFQKDQAWHVPEELNLESMMRGRLTADRSASPQHRSLKRFKSFWQGCTKSTAQWLRFGPVLHSCWCLSRMSISCSACLNTLKIASLLLVSRCSLSTGSEVFSSPNIRRHHNHV